MTSSRDAPRHRSTADAAARRRLAAARTTGALVIAYLSVGTVEDWRPYAPEVAPEWTFGPVAGWPGERYVDARAAGWQRVLARAAAGLQALGFDGLYLDNLDVAEDRPPTKDALVALVEGIGAAAADVLLIAQSGLATVDRLPVDAISREDTWARYDDGRYGPSPRQETAAILADHAGGDPDGLARLGAWAGAREKTVHNLRLRTATTTTTT